MKFVALVSGGKDSCYNTMEVRCLLFCLLAVLLLAACCVAAAVFLLLCFCCCVVVLCGVVVGVMLWYCDAVLVPWCVSAALC